MIMEHFEVHKENLEDLIVDLKKEGPKVLMDLPENRPDQTITINDFALIDDLSGLNGFMDGFLQSQDIPETVKDRVRARMFRYNGVVPKEVALNEMREAIFGKGR